MSTQIVFDSYYDDYQSYYEEYIKEWEDYYKQYYDEYYDNNNDNNDKNYCRTCPEQLLKYSLKHLFNLEFVADAPDCFKLPIFVSDFKLLAEAFYMNINCSWIAVIVKAPYFVQ